MTKNKWIALGVIALVFLAFFTPGLNNMDTSSNVYTLTSFVIVLFGTFAALFIGNNDQQKSH
jgi:hypothetical protein|tara:strand:- start:37114 stop:37299 length:186 start_codon:yes stop_codon:yes gene_type:complete